MADFQEFLNEQNVNYNPLYLRIFLKNFDKNSDFQLNFKEFMEIVLVRGDKYKKQSIIINSETKEPYIDEEIISIFKDIVLEELNLIEKICDNAIKCRSAKRFITYEAYYHIAGDERYLTNSHLYHFFKTYNIAYNLNECDNIMYRIDQDWDGKISYDEWVDIFFPAILESSSNVKDYNVSICTYKDIKTVKDLLSKKEEDEDFEPPKKPFSPKKDNITRTKNITTNKYSFNNKFSYQSIQNSQKINTKLNNIQEERKNEENDDYDPELNYKYSYKINSNNNDISNLKTTVNTYNYTRKVNTTSKIGNTDINCCFLHDGICGCYNCCHLTGKHHNVIIPY